MKNDTSRDAGPGIIERPYATATTAITGLLGTTFQRCESPSLRLEKFVVFEKDTEKVKEIERICACISNHGRPAFQLFPIPGARTLVMALQSRLIINQAGGVIENAGMCLHPHSGWPMIPGSAVKGIARAAAIQAIRGAGSDDGKTRLLTAAALVFGWCSQDWNDGRKNGSFTSDFRYAADGESWATIWRATAEHLIEAVPAFQRRIRNAPARLRETYDREPWKALGDFGGLVVFMPAHPAKGSTVSVVPDVVNCHHPEYYGGKRDIADDTENPIPNFFPAVDAGASFEFMVAPVGGRRNQSLSSAMSGIDPLESALGWLEAGLTFRGAGAKTNAGYGWFERDADAQRRADEARERAEAEARQAAREAEEAKREEERRKSLSPEQLAAEDYAAALPEGDPVSHVKGDMRGIDDLPEEHQRALLAYLVHTEAGRRIWKSDAGDAGKASGSSDKKRGKAFTRVAAVRGAAERLGVELP